MAPPPVEIIDLSTLSDSEGSEGVHGGDNTSDVGSDGSFEVEITLNDETRAQLENAIATLSETRLRSVLKELIESDITIEAALTRELVTVKRGTQNLVPRWETCGICDDEYDVNTIREDAECIFHPGDLEMNEDEFVDWDERCHGPMDCSETRQQYPENFIWSCCEGDGRSLGCGRGEHRPVVSKKRKRIS